MLVAPQFEHGNRELQVLTQPGGERGVENRERVQVCGPDAPPDEQVIGTPFPRSFSTAGPRSGQALDHNMLW